MNEFLTGLSAGQPLLWALLVLGTMLAGSFTLNRFSVLAARLAGALFRGLRRGERT